MGSFCRFCRFSAMNVARGVEIGVPESRIDESEDFYPTFFTRENYGLN